MSHQIRVGTLLENRVLGLEDKVTHGGVAESSLKLEATTWILLAQHMTRGGEGSKVIIC